MAVVLCLVAPYLEGRARSEAEVAPYLLPDDHPIKPTLDHIFNTSRATLNLHTLTEAGFTKAKPRKFTKLIVNRHPEMPGYLFKLYLDAQRYYKDKPEHHHWLMRIQGANRIRTMISERCLEGEFKVPRKWIYKLPSSHQPSSGYLAKHYILITEDMDILSGKENEEAWASDWVTPKLLDDLYGILKDLGLHDCAKPDNIPFSRDGRIAFIDTQYCDQSVDYKRLIPFLSESNKSHWKIISQAH